MGNFMSKDTINDIGKASETLLTLLHKLEVKND